MKTKKTQTLSILLAFVMVLMLIPGVAGAAQAVEYLVWNTGFLPGWTIKSSTNYTIVASDTFTMSNGVYVVNSDVTINECIAVNGPVSLILMDNCTLTASKGIAANNKNSTTKLSIYAQSQSLNTMGKLNAYGQQWSAAIGGGAENESSAPIYIHGGKITAIGGQGGAGIGGAANKDMSGTNYERGIGTVTIYGGHVTATGGKTHPDSSTSTGGGAGIGGGDKSDGCSVSIYGGTVIANAAVGTQADAIGGGADSRNWGGNSNHVSILGGSINASPIAGGSTRRTLTLTGFTSGEQVLTFVGNGETYVLESVYVDAEGKIYLSSQTVENITKIVTTQGEYMRQGSSNTYAKTDHVHSWTGNCESKCDCDVVQNPGGHLLIYINNGDSLEQKCGRTDCNHSARITLEVDQNADLMYDGLEKKPLVVSKSSNWIGNVTTSEPAYSNNTNAGEAIGNVSIRDNFSSLGEIKKSFTIQRRMMTEAAVTFPTASPIEYGQSLSESQLQNGAGNGNFAWQDSSIIPNAGTQPCTVVFTPGDLENNDYSGLAGYEESSKTVHREILVSVSQLNITNAAIGAIPVQTYTGSALTPPLAITYNGQTLAEGTDYTVAYANNIVSGTASATITFKGNYSGTQSTTFNIQPSPIENADVETIAAAEFNGSAHTPEPVVKKQGQTLVKDADYSVSYENNINRGTASMIITGLNNYSGYKTVNFVINPRSIENADVESIAAVEYNGSAHTPEPVVKDGAETLILNTDYELVYRNNLNKGMAEITVRGMGNYAQEQTVTFAIHPRSIGNAVVDAIDDVIYKGSAYTPEPVVKDPALNRELAKDTDYELVYQNNFSVGKATITIHGKGNYKEAVDVFFNILRSDSQLTPGSQTPYTYGDEIKVTFKPEKKEIIRRLSAPRQIENQAWLMFDDTVLAGPVDATEGVVGELSYSTTQKLLPLGTHDLKVVYTGGGNLKSTEEKHQITLNAKSLRANVDGDVRKMYDGTTDFKKVPLLVNGVIGDDQLSAEADGDSAEANVAEGMTFSVTDQNAVRLSGTDVRWYSLAAEDISGTVSIDRAVQAAPKGVRGTVHAIFGVTPEMEYSISLNGPWLRCPDEKIEQLTPGTYYVRYAESCNFLPGEAAKIIVLDNPPATGDATHPDMWLALMILSLLILASQRKVKIKA